MKNVNRLLTLFIFFSFFVYKNGFSYGIELENLAKKVKALPNDTQKVHELSGLCQEFWKEDPMMAKKYAEEALSLSEKLNFPLGKLKSLSLIAFTYEQLGEIALERKYIMEAITLAEKLKHPEGMAICYGSMGNTYYFESNFPQAIDWWLKALKINESLKDTDKICGSLSNIGAVNMDLENLEEALSYYLRALKINLAWGKYRHRPEILSNIGTIYSKQKNYKKALAYQQQSLDIATKVNAIPLMSSAHSSIASANIELGNLDAALEHGESSLELAKKINSHDEVGYSYFILGNIFRKIAKENPNGLLTQKFNGDRKKCLSIALRYLDSSISEFEKMGSMDRLRLSYEYKSDVLNAMGDFKGAYEYLHKSNTLKDSIFNQNIHKKLTQSTFKYEFEKKEAQTKAEQEKKDIREANIRNSILAILAGSFIFLFVVLRQRNRISKARKRSDELLLNILPAEVAEELKQKGEAEAKQMDEVTVLFTDFKGFTELSEKLTPKELVAEINECFSAFDKIMEKHGVEKIKTIGDAYMAVGGLPVANNSHAADVVKAAIDIKQFMEQRAQENNASSKPAFELRIGIHTGTVVAGIVGLKKFAYDVWGDTVNTASRMESSGEVGKINISGTTYELIKDQFQCTFRGKIQAKGKGEIDMYFIA